MKNTLIALLFICIQLSTPTYADTVSVAKLPDWSDISKYQSKAGNTHPLRNRRFISFLGANIGLKNGYGIDLQVGYKLSRYLFTGARIFTGRLNSFALVRHPQNASETAPDSTEYQDLINTPESWNAFIPEIGFGTNTQIIPMVDGNWSEVAWFGVSKPMLGSRTGWAVSIEAGINRLFKKNGNLGLSLRGRYSYGWISAGTTKYGNIPIDWSNFSLGVIYLW